MNTGGHAKLSRGYPGHRLAVTCEDDPGWLHERLALWVIKPDRFVVLTPDGDMYDKMRDSWRAAQIMTVGSAVPTDPQMLSLLQKRWRTESCSVTSPIVHSRGRGSVLPSPSLPLRRLFLVSLGVAM